MHSVNLNYTMQIFRENNNVIVINILFSMYLSFCNK